VQKKQTYTTRLKQHPFIATQSRHDVITECDCI